MSKQVSLKEKGSYNKWTLEMDRVCIDTLLQELQKGGKGDNGWKPRSYQAVIVALQQALGVTLTKENVRSRFKTWRTWYTTIIGLTNTSGFGWNESKKMIEADDITWSEYLKSHPSAVTYRYRSFTEFDDISLIVGNDKAKGIGAMIEIDAETSDQQSIQEEAEVDRENIASSPFQLPSPPRASTSEPSSSTANKSSKKKKRNRRDAEDEGLSALNASLRDIAAAIRDGPNRVDTNRVMEELMKTPGLTDDQIISGLEYVGLDKRRADIFFSLSGELRKRWPLKYI